MTIQLNELIHSWNRHLRWNLWSFTLNLTLPTANKVYALYSFKWMCWLFHSVPQQAETLWIHLHLTWLRQLLLSLHLPVRPLTCGLPTSCFLFLPLPVPEGQDSLGSSRRRCRERLRVGELRSCQCPELCPASLCRKGPAQVRVKREDSATPGVHLHPKQRCNKPVPTAATQEFLWYHELREAAELFSTPCPYG